MPGSLRRRGRRWSLARQLLVVQTLMLVVLVAAGFVLAYVDASAVAEDRARDKAVSVAASVADTPSVAAALSTPRPTESLQPYAERVRADTGVDFITIMNPRGIRFTHPNPARIGHRFLGNTAAALRGQVLTETFTGTLGPSIRAVVPVFGPRRSVVALVSVGITLRVISAELRTRLGSLIAVAVAVLAVGIGGSLLVSRRLRNQTQGVAPAELSRMFSYYQAILHAVREGLVLVGRDGTIELCNEGARELLGLTGEVEGRSVRELALPEELAEALASTETRVDELHLTDEKVLVVNTAPVTSRGRAMGSVVTLRDRTDLQALTGELNTVRGFAESLRAQAHESANRLHTVVSLVEIGRPEQAVEFATAELAIAQRLTDRVVGAVSEPVLAALLLGKAAEASERGAELVLTEDTAVEDTVLEPIGTRDLVTILGNLIDNALDAAIMDAPDRGELPKVTVTVRLDGRELLLRVTDNGPGIPADAVPAVFRRGWSTKADDGHGLGLALVDQAVRRHGGRVTVDGSAGATFTVLLPAGAGG